MERNKTKNLDKMSSGKAGKTKRQQGQMMKNVEKMKSKPPVRTTKAVIRFPAPKVNESAAEYRNRLKNMYK